MNELLDNGDGGIGREKEKTNMNSKHFRYPG